MLPTHDLVVRHRNDEATQDLVIPFQLVCNTNDEMLLALANYAHQKNLLQNFHCFPFGGFEKTCHWLMELQNGNFDIENGKILTHNKIF